MIRLGLIAVLCVCSTTAQWWDDTLCGWSPYSDGGVMPPTQRGKQVVGGIEARAHEFPWTVSLQSSAGGSHFCGGSMVSPCWVLTAAHCVEGDADTGIWVNAGDHNRGMPGEGEVVVQSEFIFVHEQYAPAIIDYDVALIRLSSCVAFNPNLTAVCPPRSGMSSDYDHQRVQVAGWGSLSSGGACCPAILRWVDMFALNHTECERMYPGDITQQMICAGEGDYSQTDTCQGDSGGPMTTINANGQFEIIGTTSWGIGCASGYPGVYGNVPNLKEWVTGKIDKNNCAC